VLMAHIRGGEWVSCAPGMRACVSLVLCDNKRVNMLHLLDALVCGKGPALHEQIFYTALKRRNACVSPAAKDTASCGVIESRKTFLLQCGARPLSRPTAAECLHDLKKAFLG